ncbi:hypothetical protein D3C76_559260 [compost metagenome]
MGKAVVELDHADVLGADAGLFVHRTGGPFGHVRADETDHGFRLEGLHRIGHQRLGEDRHVSAQAVLLRERRRADDRGGGTAGRRAGHHPGHDPFPHQLVIHDLFGGDDLLEQGQRVVGGMAAGLGADRGEGAHLSAVFAHVLTAGTAEGDQVARDVTGVATQFILNRQVIATGQRTVIEVGAGRPRTHLLEADRQGAFDLAAFDGGTGQEQRAGAGGAGIVDVEHRNRRAAHPVQHGLAASGVAVYVTGKRHLHLVIAQAGIGQCQAYRFGPHVDVARARARFAERDHADAGY